MKVDVARAGPEGAPSVAFTVGASDSEMVQLAFRGRMHLGASDYWDGNWLFSQLSGVFGGFRFKIAAQLRADEVRAFREGLERLFERLSGEARLSSLEDWIDILIAGDGSGRLEVTGSVADLPGMGNRLHFVIRNYDQTFLPPLLAELAIVESRFPVLGATD